MSAFVFTPAEIDFEMFELWLEGLTVGQATTRREASLDNAQYERMLLEIDTTDHFRMFELLQPVLEEPDYTSCLQELSPTVSARLSERFYSFDSTVMREFLNRKFTARARKDWLEEVSDYTGAEVRSCVRQYDNLRRLFDAADEVSFHRKGGGLMEALGAEFRISPQLMQSYEAILFLMCHRFNFKRKPAIHLETYLACARKMMNGWCLDKEEFSFDFDTALFARFRDFKNRVHSVDVWSNEQVFEIPGAPPKKRFESKFKPWFRGLVACGTGRDLKDFFEDLCEQVSQLVLELQPELIILLKLQDTTMAPTETYLDRLLQVINDAMQASLSQVDYTTWQLYISVVWPCVCCLHSEMAEQT